MGTRLADLTWSSFDQKPGSLVSQVGWQFTTYITECHVSLSLIYTCILITTIVQHFQVTHGLYYLTSSSDGHQMKHSWHISTPCLLTFTNRTCDVYYYHLDALSCPGSMIVRVSACTCVHSYSKDVFITGTGLVHNKIYTHWEDYNNIILMIINCW